MIEILNPTELARAKETGALVANILQTLKGRTTVGTNLLDIDRWTKDMIVDADADSCYVDYAPSFAVAQRRSNQPTVELVLDEPLDQPLGKHRVSHFNEPADVGAEHIVSGLPVFVSGGGAGGGGSPP